MLQWAHLLAITIVPLVMAGLLADDCKGGWRALWKTCTEDTNSFNIVLNLAPSIFTEIDVPYQVISHDEVCQPKIQWGHGKCSRATIHSVGNFILKKLLWSAFLSPLVLMLRNTDWARKAQERFIRIFKKNYHSIKLMESETAFCLVGPLENCLILGCMVPSILPLVAIIFISHLVSFRLSRDQLGMATSKEVCPSMPLLYLAFCLGMLWNTANFWANGLEGRWLVLLGGPGGALLIWVGVSFFLTRRAGASQRQVQHQDSIPATNHEDETVSMTSYVSME